METFPALLALYGGNLSVTGELHSQRPATRSFDVFFCAWTNDWVNNRDAGDMRRHRTHYDAIEISRKVWRRRDLYFELLDRSEIWQAPLSNCKAMR